jgi:hypothetical protein
MTQKAFNQIMEGLTEALAFARGETGANLHVPVTQLSASDAEMIEACEYLMGKLHDLRTDIALLECVDYIRPSRQGPTIRQLVGPELRGKIRDLRAAWQALEDARPRTNDDDEPCPF